MEKEPRARKPFMMPTWVAVLFHVIIWAILLGLVGYAIMHPETVAVIFPDFKWSKINYAAILKAILFVWVILTIFRVIKRTMIKWIQRQGHLLFIRNASWLFRMGHCRMGWFVAPWCQFTKPCRDFRRFIRWYWLWIATHCQ